MPLVVAVTTDGFLAAQGHRALKDLTHITNEEMPLTGPRLTLIAGLALCESAAGAYAAWHWQVACRFPILLPHETRTESNESNSGFICKFVYLY